MMDIKIWEAGLKKQPMMLVDRVTNENYYDNNYQLLSAI